ncbi:MAG TPA: glycosyl hydrolase family 28 protein [Asticcacaulis sp.]|nr:glycosyl hydrolase family 28 protein [Asticcacaulis sp.]
MSSRLYTRRWFNLSLLSTPLLGSAAQAIGAPAKLVLITDFGAVGDDATLNTKAIQSAIDQVAARGGGTLVVPQGTFVSGALFLKPKVNLYLDKGAVLKCSTDLSNFPAQRTRIEGHFEDAFTPGLINADGCDGFKMTGEGTLDGAGMPIWELFWKNRAANPGFANIGMARARLAVLSNSRHVTVDGITFKDSQFWNLHLYNCQDVLVRNARFQVPDDYRQAPSTDGIDIDSCQRVTVDGCFFSVTDDCIACKGSKGPFALDDKTSPPVEHIRIRNCTFKRGGGVLTLGSEATIVRDVIAENCHVIGPVRVATIKLRPDTPQHYEDIHFRNITLDTTGGTIINMAPWKQYFDLKGQQPPHSVVKNITLTGIKGKIGSFGSMAPNPGQTDISDITFKDFDVQLTQDKLKVAGVTNLKFENVVVNGKPVTAPAG